MYGRKSVGRGLLHGSEKKRDAKRLFRKPLEHQVSGARTRASSGGAHGRHHLIKTDTIGAGKGCQGRLFHFGRKSGVRAHSGQKGPRQRHARKRSAPEQSRMSCNGLFTAPGLGAPPYSCEQTTNCNTAMLQRSRPPSWLSLCPLSPCDLR